jgi:hypothetical protein
MKVLERLDSAICAFLDRNFNLLAGVAIGYLLAVLPERIRHYQSFISETPPVILGLYAVLLLVVVGLMGKATHDSIKKPIH